MARQPSVRAKLLKADRFLNRARTEMIAIYAEACPVTLARLRGVSTTIGLAIDRVREAIEREEECESGEQGTGSKESGR